MKIIVKCQTIIDKLSINVEIACNDIFEQYLENVEAYCNWLKVHDPLTHEEVDPDEKFMRSIENQIGISENGKKPFREEILIRLSVCRRRGKSFELHSHERLHTAIQKFAVSQIETRFTQRESIRELTSMMERAVVNFKNGDFRIAIASVHDIEKLTNQIEVEINK